MHDLIACQNESRPHLFTMRRRFVFHIICVFGHMLMHCVTHADVHDDVHVHDDVQSIAVLDVTHVFFAYMVFMLCVSLL